MLLFLCRFGLFHTEVIVGLVPSTCNRTFNLNSDSNSIVQILGYGRGVARELTVPVHTMPCTRLARYVPDKTSPMYPKGPPFQKAIHSHSSSAMAEAL